MNNDIAKTDDAAAISTKDNPNTIADNLTTLVNNPHAGKPTLALFVHASKLPDIAVSSGLLELENTHVILLSSDNIQQLVDIIDEFMQDLMQQRDIFVAHLTPISQGQPGYGH